MMMSKTNYRIKLMSGNNVVMAEANGYESEIFVPQIVDGRITFLNVIPNRRCCQLKANKKEGGNTFRAVVKNELRTPAHTVMAKMGRFSAGSDKENESQSSRPLAMSTPIFAGKNSMRGVRSRAGTSSRMTPGLGGESTLPTPEPVRRAAPIRSDEIMDNSMYHVPRGVKVLRLYHNSADGTPRKVGRLVSTSNGGSITQQEVQNLSRITDFSTSFRINASSQMSNPKLNGLVSSTPLNKRLTNIASHGSVSKWRKCLTPKKTYSRRGNHKVPKHDKSMSSLKNCIQPSYLVNPTMGPKTTHTVEVKKRRLRKDEKVRIASKVLKKRQNKHNELASSTSNTEYLRKSRKHFGKSPMSAFDLLTNSNRTRCIANNLNQQFRRGCINKASSTCQKYKVLSTVPALQEDEQVLKLTQTQKQRCGQFGGSADDDCVATQMVSRATSTMLSVPCNNNAGGPQPTAATFAMPRIPPQKSAISSRHGKTGTQTTHYMLKF